jgi:hypothetical protein
LCNAYIKKKLIPIKTAIIYIGHENFSLKKTIVTDVIAHKTLPNI